jgi:CubicO group peptidase (beta-lactamase class C family)
LGRITIRHLLTHTSGLPDYNDDPAYFNEVHSGQLSNEARIARIARLPLRFEPGSRFGYSNDGYHLLGAIIERVTGQTYEQLLTDRILHPLGLTSTGYIRQSAAIPNLASGYRKSGSAVEPARYYRESPASGMYSTTSDLRLFYAAITNGHLLSRQSRALVLGGSSANNTYGFHVRFDSSSFLPDTVLVVEGDGAVFGYFARTLWVPRDQVFIALLTNVRAQQNYLPEIAQGLAARVYERKPTPRPVRPE